MMEAASRYSCYYCDYSSDNYKTIIGHLCERHPERWLQYRETELDCKTGKLGRRTKVYESIRPLDCDISVTSDNRLCVQNGNRSKRKKTNTPKKVTEETCPSNSNTQRCLFENVQDVQLSHMFDEMEIGCDYRMNDNNENEDHDSVTNDNNENEDHDSVTNDNNENEDHDSVTNDNNENEDHDIDMNRLIECLPSVIQNLEKYGQAESFIKWCTLVSERRIPLDNICYLLFLDLIEWYSQPITTQMRYFRSETRQFWEIGYRLFKGKFLRFMSGPRNIGQIISGSNQRGLCSPQSSKINFAIPALNNLSEEKLDPIFPGVMVDSISNIGMHLPSKCVKLGIDGKKISRGKGKTMGDIDCWGFEAKPTLQDRKLRHQNEITDVNELIQTTSRYDQEGVNGMPSYAIDDLLEKLKQLILTISLRLEDLRNVLLRLNQGIQKFLKLGESTGDWRKSRYAPVIGCLKVAKYETEQAISHALRLINDICLVCAKANKSQHLYSCSDTVNLSSQGNYHQLRPDNDPSDTTHVKQRTERWFSIRSEALVTGSTCNVALGLGQLKQQQKHFDQVVLGKDKPPIPEDQRRNMEYGTVHENDAIATVVGRILPALFPELEYFEEGCARICYNSKESFLVVSPDGSLKEGQDDCPKMMYETKCKTPNSYTTDVYYNIPKYYITQLLCEMYAYDCKELLFTCWSSQSVTVFKVEFDESLWLCLWELMCTLYGSEKLKRPTKFHEHVTEIKEKINAFSKSNVSFIGEFPSCVASNVPEYESDNSDGAYIACSKSVVSKDDDELIPPDKLLSLLHCVKKWQEEAYQLCRTTATEILMFMVNDLDRKFSMELSNSHPIAYALKGPSMTHETFRDMTNHVIDKCKENGLTVLATSSDGQWNKYGSRDIQNKPLTLFQLQKDTWSECYKQKSVLLKEFRGRYKVNTLDDVEFEKIPGGPIIVHGHKRDSNLTVFEAPRSRYTSASSGSTTKGGDIASDGGQTKQGNTVETTYDLTGFMSQDIVNDFDDETMIQIDRMLLNVELYQQTQIPQINLNDANLSSDLQTIFQENSTYTAPSFADLETNMQDSIEWNRGVSPRVDNNESFENTNIDVMDTMASPITTGQSFCMTTSVLNFNDRNDESISGAVFSALTTVNADTEFQDVDTNISVNENKSLSQQTVQSVNAVDTNEYPNDTAVAINQEHSHEPYQQPQPCHEYHSASDFQYQEMLNHLQTDANSSKKNSWNNKTTNDLKNILSSKEKACETLTAKELIVCLCALAEKREKLGIRFGKSWKKVKLYDTLCATLTLEVRPSQNNPARGHCKSPSKMTTLLSKYVNCIPRATLACVKAEEAWPSKHQEWLKQSPIQNDIKINDNEETVRWFSKPHVDNDGSVRFHFTDSCHILTCLRTKLCTTGIEGLNKQAWVKAAESDETNLNQAIVVECLDKQSVPFATRMFDEDVETFMDKNGFVNEKTFVRLIRRWFEAEDAPGISSVERCSRRIEIRKYLLRDVNFGRFPPVTQYVKGFSVSTYEALLIHLDRKLQMYFFAPGGSYNVRAMGTQEVEQFFSCMRDLDPSSIGTPKPDDIPDMIATAAMLDNARLDPERPFFMRTSRATVYPECTFHNTDEFRSDESLACVMEDVENSSTACLLSKDHYFDLKARRRVQGKRKDGTISEFGKPARNEGGVRKHHRVEHSKVPAEYRMKKRSRSPTKTGFSSS